MRLFLLWGFLAAGFAAGAQSPGGVPVASWWRADAAATVFSDAGTTPATDNSALYQWNDYTGHGYNFIQATAGNRPIYSNAQSLANFNPTVTFTSDYMDFTPAAGDKIIDRENGTLYTAGYMNVVGNTGFFGFDATNDFPGLHTYPVGGRYNLLFFTNGGPGYQGLSDSAFQAKTFFTAGAWWQNDDGATTAYAKVKVSLNGDRKVYSGSQVYNVNTTGYDDMRIGWDSNWGALNGQLNELMVFEDTLTSAQMDQVESYLAIKYGSTYGYGLRDYKSADGTVVWSAASNSGYHQNIAGIARDDNGALYQKQSWSTNPGQQVLIGTTGLANTNAANTGTLADGQYLVWGDNGLDKSPAIVETGVTGTNYRFAAVWKVQNTGNVGTVRVAWPAGLTNLKLLQNSDPTFAAGNTVTDMSGNTTIIDGVSYNYADVTLADGQYFTFAALVVSPGGIATLPAVWYRPDMVTNSTWKDASINSLDLTTQDATTTYSVAVNNGNQVHNFHKWTNGYTNVKYFSYREATNPVFGTWNDGGITTTASTDYAGGYYYMPLTVFGVARDTVVNSIGAITGIDNDQGYAAEPGFGIYGGKQSFYRYGNGADLRNETIASVVPLNATAVYSWRPPAGGSTATGNDSMQMGLNGNYVKFLMNRKSSVAGPHINIGTDNFAYPSGFDGSIQEVIWYKDSLSYSEIAKVETYLAVKYGTTLSHDYVSNAFGTVFSLTTNNGYTSNIAGIGRDDTNGGLYQKQSNATNPGKQVLIGVGGLANTNAGNTGTLTNGQYLVWGDNGLDKTLSVLETNVTGTNLRFAAVWKVQNTGDVGTVRVAWPAGLANLKLLQSTDPSFATVDAVTDMSANTTVINGVTYNYADVTLADGQYFTFAAFAQAPGGVVNGLLMWHKANDGVTTAGAKDTWQDVSGNGRDVTQNNNTAYEPALVTNSSDSADGKRYFFNFNPFYHFDGTDDFFFRTNDGYFPSNTSAGSTYGVMFNSAIGGGYRTPYGWGDDDPNFERNGDNFQVWRDNGNVIDENVGATNFTAHIGGMNWRGGGDNGVHMNINGRVYSANANIGTIDDNFAIGSEAFNLTGAGHELFQGGIAEVFAYSKDYQDEAGDARQRINSYLAIKYGITLSNDGGTAVPDYLSSTSRVVWNATTNAGYDHNIAGLAYDNNSALVQNQSMSGNAGPQVLIGTTGLANTNAANSVSLSDGQFLLWGDNGLGKSPSVYTGNSFSNINVRFAAVWKVQNTGNVGTVRVAWPSSGYHNLSIIQSDDPVFGSGDAVTPMSNTITIDGIDYNYADVTFTNGQYFTFAIKMEHAPGGVFTGLSYWYRADKDAANTGNGTNVTSWTDFAAGTVSGQMGANPYPLYHTGSADYFNFNPGINFTSGNQSLGNTNVRTLSSLDYNLFSLTKEGMQSGGGNPRFFSSLVSNNDLSGSINYWDALGLFPDGRIERITNAYQDRYFLNPGNVNFAANEPSIMFYDFTDISMSKGLNGAPNGAPFIDNTPRGYLDGGHTFGSTQYTIDGTGNGSDNAGFIGNIGELIIYGAGSITPQQRNRVDAYLAIKYGITLDTAESYLSSATVVVWDSTADAPFYHNVAGIAHDEISALYQKQSKSQMPDVDSQVVVGLGDIYATNMANPGTLTNGQFLMWGDNGQTVRMNNTAATYETFTYNGSDANRRMTRVWKVRNTHMMDSVKIRFPQAAVGTTTITGEGANAGYVIIFSPDPSFDKDITVSMLTENGDDYDVMAAFPDGVSYFTFGKVVDTRPPPGLCTGIIYLAQDNPTSLRMVDISSNPFTYPTIGLPSSIVYNAIGVNPKDGYIYGMRSKTGEPNDLLKIDPRDGSVTNLGVPAGLASAARMNSGGFDSSGNYYVKPLGNNSTMYKINLSTLSATPISLSLSFAISDMAYNVKDSLFYCVFSSGRFATINPVTGVVSAIGSIPDASQIYGAMYSSVSGAIYGGNNNGGIYQFNTTTGQRVLLSSAPITTNNDGAHCVDAPFNFLSDLYVTKTTTDTGYYPGDTITYTVVAGNNGPFGVLNGRVIDSVPGGIPDSNMTYTAVASTGSATAVTGMQSGSIDDTVNIPKGGTVTYSISLVIPAGFAGDLENIAQIMLPPVNSYDTAMANNSDTVTLEATELPIISGTIFDDTTGLRDGSVNGPELKQDIGLKIVLADDNTNTVVAQTTINTSNGFYGFYSIPQGDYHVILTTNSYAVGATAPASAELPSGWTATGEFIGTGPGNDGNPDGMLAVTVSTSNITDADFGIDQLPTAGSGTIYLTNYGANQPITLPANAFTITDPSNDPDGRVDSIIILTFPPGIDSITVDDTSFTSAPVEIHTDSAGNLISPVVLYPHSSDSGVVHLDYFAVDNAGEKSAVQGTGRTHLRLPVDTCYVPVQGHHFSWYYQSPPPGLDVVTETITQPPANYGFSFDIDTLDNSFNMTVNGVKLAVREIQFQSNGTSGINIMFKDGDRYEINTPDVWQMGGDSTISPLIRVVISPYGEVSMYGSKTSGGPLFPLKLFRGNLFNAIPWNDEGTNTIVVTQAVSGPTTMAGYGYGRNQTICKYGITGTVYDDVNGLADNTVNGTGLDQDLGLNAVLIDESSDTVVAVSTVSATDGSYGFSDLLNNNYAIILTTAAPAVGDGAPAAALPDNWINTGEFLGSGTGDDGTSDGMLHVTVDGDSPVNANFGILLLHAATINPDLMNRGIGNSINKSNSQ